MDTQYTSFSRVALCLLPRVEVPRVKRTPVDTFHSSLWMGAEAHKEKGEEKKEEEKLAIKGRGTPEKREAEKGGRVTLRSIEQGNTIKVVRAAGGSVVEGRESCFSFVLTPSPSRSREQDGTGRDESACTRAARRAKASLSLRRVPRFEIKHLASRPPACMTVCVRVHACTYIRVHASCPRFQTSGAL